MSFSDILRVFLGFQCGIVFAATAIIVYHYSRLLLLGYKGILPWHIVLIGTSYTIFVAGYGIEIINRLGSPFNYWVVLGIVGATLGNIGLVLIFHSVYSKSVQPPKGWYADRYLTRKKHNNKRMAKRINKVKVK